MIGNDNRVLDYLASYAWAIFVIVIAGVAFYSIGILNPSFQSGKQEIIPLSEQVFCEKHGGMWSDRFIVPIEECFFIDIINDTYYSHTCLMTMYNGSVYWNGDCQWDVQT